jgi:hypothetical protein
MRLRNLGLAMFLSWFEKPPKKNRNMGCSVVQVCGKFLDVLKGKDDILQHETGTGNGRTFKIVVFKNRRLYGV